MQKDTSVTCKCLSNKHKKQFVSCQLKNQFVQTHSNVLGNKHTPGHKKTTYLSMIYCKHLPSVSVNFWSTASRFFWRFSMLAVLTRVVGTSSIPDVKWRASFEMSTPCSCKKQFHVRIGVLPMREFSQSATS